MPELLTDKVNYEVMGANEWRHAPTIAKMHDELAALYLADHRLVRDRPAPAGFLAQEVDLADRETSTNVYYPYPIIRDALDVDGHGVVFCVGEPLAQPMSIDGCFTGELRVMINKKLTSISA